MLAAGSLQQEPRKACGVLRSPQERLREWPEDSDVQIHRRLIVLIKSLVTKNTVTFMWRKCSRLLQKLKEAAYLEFERFELRTWSKWKGQNSSSSVAVRLRKFSLMWTVIVKWCVSAKKKKKRVYSVGFRVCWGVSSYSNVFFTMHLSAEILVNQRMKIAPCIQSVTYSVAITRFTLDDLFNGRIYFMRGKGFIFFCCKLGQRKQKSKLMEKANQFIYTFQHPLTCLTYDLIDLYVDIEGSTLARLPAVTPSPTTTSSLIPATSSSTWLMAAVLLTSLCTWSYVLCLRSY